MAMGDEGSRRRIAKDSAVAPLCQGLSPGRARGPATAAQQPPAEPPADRASRRPVPVRGAVGGPRTPAVWSIVVSCGRPRTVRDRDEDRIPAATEGERGQPRPTRIAVGRGGALNSPVPRRGTVPRPVPPERLHVLSMSAQRRIRPGGHFMTPRQTLESAVQWCIEMGAEAQNPRWRTLLAESESTHQLYRSWPMSRPDRYPVTDLRRLRR